MTTDPEASGTDLHVHSTFSDGQHSPAAVMALAADAGLTAVALTDHDTTGGFGAAAAAASELGLRFIPGVEISSHSDGRDIHLLAWFVDPDHAGLRNALARLAAARERRLQAMLKALSLAGAPVQDTAVRKESDGHVPGRPHVAAALVRAGHADSVQAAFDGWIGQGRPGFVALERIPAAEVMALVRAAGGVTGLAHPGLAHAGRALPILARSGLAAVECDHPSHDPGQRRQWRETAQRLGLVATAGSDFHGSSRRHGLIGSESLDGATLAALEACRA
ncbi:MAG: PHP domain-containing protein [Acidobacteria bacterium]|nr:PHP domain-containing protein [Acidobacteriota bacterium]